MVKETKPIVHIAPDEKFIDAAYEIYERAFPGLNKFVILIKDDALEVKYLSKEKAYQFILVKNGFINKVLKTVQEAKVIVFHGLDENQAKVASAIRELNAKIVWTVFGREVYNKYKIFRDSSYGRHTYKEFIFSIKRWINNIFREPYYFFIKREKHPHQLVIEVLRQMDFVSILYNEERNKFIELGIVDPDIQFLKFTYYPLDIIIDQNAKYTVGKNILIGNSASYTNNHLEAFEVLTTLNLEDRKITVPLSYGDEDYASDIIKRGALHFGKNFIPLTNFLPLQEYQKILESCGIVIMNHYRQQAVGNVLNTLYMGAKVFLSEKNTLFHYLKRIGCTVYSIEKDLTAENKSVFRLLPKELQEKNRKILRNELSTERICNELQSKLSEFLV